MQEKLKLEIANLLNGVSVEEVARHSGDDPADVSARFVGVMRLVEEYQVVHCVPFFTCRSIPAARRNRITVLAVLSAIERWDAFERDLMLKLFKGQHVGDIGRDDLQKILRRTLDAIPNYLHKKEHPEYFRDPRAFIAAHRDRVIEVLERFVSLNNPLIYRRIEHIGIDASNALEVVTGMAHQGASA